MAEKDKFKLWLEQMEKVKRGLLAKPDLLRYYSNCLKASEENTIYQGRDIFNMVIGLCQYLSDFNLMPGTGNMNLVYVLGQVQKETKLDLGVCGFLDDRIEKFYKKMLKPQQTMIGSMSKKDESLIPKCRTKEGIFVGDFNVCIPPERVKCKSRSCLYEHPVRS